MTREEILALRPGRELDCLIHSKVMDRCVGLMRYADPEPPGLWMHSDRNLRCDVCGNEDGGLFADLDELHDLLAYSEEIADAWEIINKLKDRHHWAVVSNNGKVQAEFYRKGDGICAREQADTPALAICYAALVVLEGKEC